MPMSPRLLRPRAAAATGFNPRTISGLEAWWDFADTATLGPTSSGTGAVSNNGPVKYVADKSGNGRHMIQPGADSVSPSFLASAQNARSVASFDGGDSLQCSTTLTITSETVFQILRMDAASATFARGFTQRSGTQSDAQGSPIYIPIIRDNSGNFIGSFINPVVASRAFTPGSWLLFISRHTGTQIQNSVNNGTAATQSNTLGTGTYDLLALGSGVSTSGDKLTGRIAETLVYSRSVTDAERNAIAEYLMLKWGIA